MTKQRQVHMTDQLKYYLEDKFQENKFFLSDPSLFLSICTKKLQEQ